MIFHELSYAYSCFSGEQSKEIMDVYALSDKNLKSGSAFYFDAFSEAIHDKKTTIHYDEEFCANLPVNMVSIQAQNKENSIDILEKDSIQTIAIPKQRFAKIPIIRDWFPVYIEKKIIGNYKVKFILDTS